MKKVGEEEMKKVGEEEMKKVERMEMKKVERMVGKPLRQTARSSAMSFACISVSPNTHSDQRSAGKINTIQLMFNWKLYSDA